MAATDYDFALTRNKLIERAMRIVGALYAGETLRAEQFTQGNQALNSMIKAWQNKHVFLWTRLTETLAFTTPWVSKQFDNDPGIHHIDAAYRVDSDGNDVELEIISWEDYQRIYDKDSSGTPVVIAFDGIDQPTAYLWPVPTANTSVKCLIISKLQDWDTATSSGGFPSRWIEAIVMGLAASLADEYGISRTEKNDLNAKALMEFQLAKGVDRDRPTMDSVVSAFPTRRRR